MQWMVGTSCIQDWMEDLNIPTHFLMPFDVEQFADEDLVDISMLGEMVTAEIAPGAGELLPYQTPELFIARLLDLVSEKPREAFVTRKENCRNRRHGR